MQTFTYEEIREKALKQGITDNKLRVGLWASSNGYIKKQTKDTGKGCHSLFDTLNAI